MPTTLDLLKMGMTESAAPAGFGLRLTANGVVQLLRILI
jgi:hypothetical protein